MGDETVAVQVVMDLLAKPLVFGFAENEVAEFTLVDRYYLGESPCRRAITLKLNKKLRKNLVVFGTLKILT